MVAKKEPKEITYTFSTPTATQENIGDVAVRTGNLEMLRIWQKRQFLRAFAQAQAELPSIIKDREVDYTGKAGRVHYKYEDIGPMLRQLRPILAKYGLSLRFPTKSILGDSGQQGTVEMTAILAHDDGHEETSQMSGHWDASGGKNQVQAQGSTATYLQRYLTKTLLGFAAAYDDDGRASSPETTPETTPTEDQPVDKITDEQLQRLTDELVAAHMSSDDLVTLVRRRYPAIQKIADIPAEAFSKCITTIKDVAAKKGDEGNGKDSAQ